MGDKDAGVEEVARWVGEGAAIGQGGSHGRVLGGIRMGRRKRGIRFFNINKWAGVKKCPTIVRYVGRLTHSVFELTHKELEG